jgi:protein KTI12
MTRWDSPMFTVIYEDNSPPFDDVWEALIGSPGQKKVVRPNAATVLVRRRYLAYHIM